MRGKEDAGCFQSSGLSFYGDVTQIRVASQWGGLGGQANQECPNTIIGNNRRVHSKTATF